MAENKTNLNEEQVIAAESKISHQSWFCVALNPTGDVFRRETETPGDFIDVLKNALVGWVDFITDEFDKEAPVAAAKLGFSESLATSLIGEQQLTYQDLNTELGLKLPSIQIRNFDVTIYPLVILLRKNFVLTIHPHNVDRRLIRLRRYADTFIRKMSIAMPAG